MIELKVYNMEGKEQGKIEVDEAVFGVDFNNPLVHQVVVAQLANKRQGTKSTLTRTEVRGGGVKPFRQKGTGRARQGSIRAPQFRHGGVVFAPKPRDFSKKVNKKMKDNAMKCVLSEKIRNDEFIVLDSFTVAEAKTKNVVKALNALNATKNSMIVLAAADENVKRASGNIQGLITCTANLVNVYDLVKVGKCFITVDAVKSLEKIVLSEKAEEGNE